MNAKIPYIIYMDEKKPCQVKPKQFPLKTEIKTITKILIRRITALGYDIYISYSDVSKSRYLEIMLPEHEKILVRISDHPTDYTKRGMLAFDIYTKKPRSGAVNYLYFFHRFKYIMNNQHRTENRPRFYKVYRYNLKPIEKKKKMAV